MHVESSIKMKDRITQIITPITKQEAEPGNYPAGLTEKKNGCLMGGKENALL